MSIYSGAIVDKLEYYLRKYFKWDAVLDNCLDGCGMRSIIEQQMETKTLRLRNEMIMKSYRTIESKITDSAAIRHEMKHKIVVLDALYQKGDYDSLGNMIEDIKEQNTHLAQTQFTENFTVNTILQDAAYRAAQSDISFEAVAYVPARLSIAENDLCELLMNMH